MHFPDSPRFHIIDADSVHPRFGRISSRPIYVYVPEAAEHDHRRRFPVIYCQDGQNIWDDPHACFGHGGWSLNRTADELAAAGKIEPVILVGIPNSDERYRDYTPRRSFKDVLDHPYANYLCDVVKRYVDRHYPTKRDRQHTAVLGSSLGGLVSLWIAHTLPETFGNAACLSGAFQVRDRTKQAFADFLVSLDHQKLHVYIDSGTVDDGAKLTRRIAATYRDRGWRDDIDLMHFEQKGAEHNERYWRERAWRALMFLFGRHS
jgi:enterochelin esterase-like enzyme